MKVYDNALLYLSNNFPDVEFEETFKIKILVLSDYYKYNPQNDVEVPDFDTTTFDDSNDNTDLSNSCSLLESDLFDKPNEVYLNINSDSDEEPERVRLSTEDTPLVALESDTDYDSSDYDSSDDNGYGNNNSDNVEESKDINEIAFDINVDDFIEYCNKKPRSQDEKLAHFVVEKVSNGDMTFSLVDELLEAVEAPRYMNTCKKIVDNAGAEWSALNFSKELKICPCKETAYAFDHRNLECCLDKNCKLLKKDAMVNKYESIRSILLATYLNQDLMKRVGEVRHSNDAGIMNGINDGLLFKETLNQEKKENLDNPNVKTI